MKRPSDDAPPEEDLRAQILGLGERSARKSYYPMLRAQLAELSRFRAALDGANDSILLLCARRGTIEDANEAACRALRRPRAELIGRPIGDAIPALAEHLGPDADLAEGHRTSLSTMLRADDGAEIPVEVTLSFVRVGREPYAVAVARDVSERRRTQQALRLLADATVTLSSSLDLDATLAAFAAVVLPHFGDLCAVYRGAPAGALEPLASTCTDAVDGSVMARLTAHLASGAARALHAGGAADLQRLRLGALLVAPFSAGAATSGALVVATAPGGRTYDDLDLDVAAQLAQRLAMALENARLYAEAQAAAQRAEESLARLDTLLLSAPVGIAFLDCDLRYVRLNATLAEIHGCPPERTIGRTLHEVVPDLAVTVAPVLHEVLRTGQPVLNVEVAHRFATLPTSTHWLASYYPVRTPSGALLGVGLVVVDITARKQAEVDRELLLACERSARGEAERASRLKDDFVAAVSHELRTPLHAILGWTQLACRPGAAAQQTTKALAIVDRNARVLEQIVADLLDASRITAGKFEVDLAPIALRGVVETAVEVLRASAEAKGVSLRESETMTEGRVLGDAPRLHQVVSNLVSNAIKFTPRGGRVDVDLVATADQVVLVVSDTGQGIEPGFLPYVFDRFRQADPSLARRHGGLGLGLAIVRQVVTLHGGTVRVESAGVGRGARFTVTLPVIRASVEARALPATTATDLGGVRVLVVEDEPDAQELVRRLLEERGADVATAASAPGALACLAARVPDVLVSDIGLPGMDGFELIRRIRAGDVAGAGEVPAVALTAFARTEDRARALREGFQGYLTKPVDAVALLAMVARCARRRDEARPAAAPAQAR
jgi:PAS domain S-box-containing protein